MDSFIIKLLFTLAAVLWASLMYYNGMEADFQLTTRTRILLFCCGCVTGFCAVWLILPESFWNYFGLKVGLGFAGGLQFAFVMPKRWQNMKKQAKKTG